MRRKWLPVALPLIGVLACGVGLLLQPPAQHCIVPSHVCTQQGMVRDLWMMLLPLLFLFGHGVWRGLRQLRRTHGVVRTMLHLPRAPQPPLITALAQTLELTDRIDIVVHDAPEAFCYGLVRPRICLTSGLVAVLSPQELEAVLRHERHHLRQGDPLRTLGWTILSGTFWWLEDRAEHAHLVRELAADRAVIAEQGRSSLASALLKLLTTPRAGGLSSTDMAISGLSVTDARIDQLVRSEQLAPPTASDWQWLFLPALLILSVLLCSTVMSRFSV
jgi:hypothetical protein